MADQLTCRCGEVYPDLVDLLNHCRLMHPDVDVDPVDPEVVDLTTARQHGRLPTHWATLDWAAAPVVPPPQWADEMLAALARGLDLPPGLTLAWDTTPLIRGKEPRPPSVE